MTTYKSRRQFTPAPILAHGQSLLGSDPDNGVQGVLGLHERERTQDTCLQRIQNDLASNEFEYDETVYAAYVSYARPINQQWSFLAGLRTELTDARGILTPFAAENEAPPVEQNYLSWFPNMGLPAVLTSAGSAPARRRASTCARPRVAG